jgi:hypothetical protein
MSSTIAIVGRNAAMSAHVSQLGNAAIAEFWTGTKSLTPSGTKLASLVFGADVTEANGGSAGGVANGILTFGGFTQTNSSHVNGTPTFVLLKKADNTPYAAIDIGSGPTNIQYSGTVVNGQNITGSLTWTAGNA